MYRWQDKKNIEGKIAIEELKIKTFFPVKEKIELSQTEIKVSSRV